MKIELGNNILAGVLTGLIVLGFSTVMTLGGNKFQEYNQKLTSLEQENRSLEKSMAVDEVKLQKANDEITKLKDKVERQDEEIDSLTTQVAVLQEKIK